MRYGRGPKLVFVRRYPRWKSGRRERVGEARRGHDHSPFRSYRLPPSITVNARWRSGAVTTGSIGCVASAAPNRSSIDHLRSAMPSAMAGGCVSCDRLRIAKKIAALKMRPPTRGGLDLVDWEVYR